MQFAKNQTLIINVCEVAIATLANVQAFERNPANPLSITATLTATPVYGSTATKQFTQQHQLTPNGSIYKQKVVLSYPGLQEENMQYLYTLDHQKMVVLFTDQNGQGYYMGSPDAPANINWQFNTGNNGFQIEFEVTDIYPVGYQVTTSSTPVSFSSAFSNGFN